MIWIDQLQKQFVFPSVFRADPVLFIACNLKAFFCEKVKAWFVVFVYIAVKLMKQKHVESVPDHNIKGLAGISFVPVFSLVDQYADPCLLMETVNLKKIDTSNGFLRVFLPGFQIDHHS